jgi:glycosyltransferase involved in cell wall biosynthesis
MPKVSVIVPVYNVERYIAETLQSILNQTFSDFELLIIDDESRDRSIEICQRVQDSRIKIIHQPNRGLAGARNTGIRQAQGHYLAFLDSDDLWLPDKLEKHVAHLDAHPTVGVSFSCSAFIDENSQPLGIYQTPKLQDITPEHLFCRNPISNGSTPVIRREVFQAIRFQENIHGTVEDFYFDDHFRQSEDIECWLRIALQTSWKIEGISEALTLYRVNAGGLSANLMNQLQSWENIIQKTNTYNPEFVAQWGPIARAYQLRYLARRAVSQRDGNVAVALVNQALKTHWKIVISEPLRTILTISAAYLLHVVPKPLYQRLESAAIQVAGRMQKQRIAKHEVLENIALKCS